MGSINDVYYFVVEMFVIMRNTSDVLFLYSMIFTLLYFIINKNIEIYDFYLY